MAITLIESKLAGGGSIATSQTVNFTTQPSSGTEWIVGSGVFFPDATDNHTVTAPASLTEIQNNRSGGQLSSSLRRKSSSGSDGTATTTAITPDAEGLGTIALNLSGAAYDTSGKATTNAATSLAVSTDGSVAVDGSTAYLLVVKRGNSCTVSASGWTLVSEVRTTNSALVETFLFTKTVNSGAVASGTFTLDTGSATFIDALIIVEKPTNADPTVSDPGTIYTALNYAEPIGTLVTVADADSALSTIRYQGTSGKVKFTYTASGTSSISAGTNNTHDLTITASNYADLLAAHALTTMTSLMEDDTDTVTITATDPDAATDAQAFTVDSVYMDITADTEEDLTDTIALLQATSAVEGAYIITATAIDEVSLESSDSGTITVSVVSPVGTSTLLFLRRRRRQ